MRPLPDKKKTKIRQARSNIVKKIMNRKKVMPDFYKQKKISKRLQAKVLKALDMGIRTTIPFV